MLRNAVRADGPTVVKLPPATDRPTIRRVRHPDEASVAYITKRCMRHPTVGIVGRGHKVLLASHGEGVGRRGYCQGFVIGPARTGAKVEIARHASRRVYQKQHSPFSTRGGEEGFHLPAASSGMRAKSRS